ncbi:epoxide hydrolase family protein [Ensifer adhaerens]|uniref:epoxide hydrolase family protein n=1 Tax=Ensifer adhaerens TaxID=106592 RepID=UPI000CF13DA3|nr:epoxide hydrolase family protein [Ensifer adhaerens]
MPITPPKSFRIALAADTLGDLRRRLAESRIADILPAPPAHLGLAAPRLREIVNHWQSFDWRKTETEINVVPAFKTEIDGIPIHFIHVRGKGANSIPLVLTNGWPSCFVELLPLIPLLTEPVNGLSFDVVIPSLPGYGFSGPPQAPGLNITRIATMWADLMAGLSYSRFLAHGSDMGAGVVERLRANHGDRLLGAHMMNVNWFYPRPADITPAEEAYLGAAEAWRMQEGAYAMLHGSKPQTIAAVLADSPVGLAAWIVEKLDAWTDDAKGLPLDTICTLLTIYWATGTIGSSLYLYYEAFGDVGVMSPPPKYGAPVAVAVFPKDILPAPRVWGERWYDIARWTVMPAGGHFPGFERPDLLAADLRGFAGDLGL